MPEINGPFTRPGDRRTYDFMAAHGLLSWGGPPTASNSTTSQTVCGQAHYLYAGDVVTNIIVCVQTAASGTAPSNIKLGLWDSASTPNCLAVTAELSADARWTTAGWKVNALSSPYTVTASGIYYPAFWQNGAFSVTNETLVLSTGGLGGPANQIGSTFRPYTALKTGATTMAVSDTGTYSQSGTIPLFHLS